MFCDANGRPNPDGDYQFIDGKMILRDGRSARMNIMLMDSAHDAPGFIRDGSVQIADAQVVTFRDSPQGQEFLAQLRSSPTHRHPTSAPLTADAESAAIRQHLAGSSQPQTAADGAAIASAHQAMERAWQTNDLNAWRKG